MNPLLESLLHLILLNDCRYAEVYLEEIGKSSNTQFSTFKLLLKSFDPGFHIEAVQALLEDLSNPGIQELTLITLDSEKNELISFNEEGLLSKVVTKPSQYGTSLSFIFTGLAGTPEDLYSVLTRPEYFNRIKFEYTPKSFFRDLSQLAFRSSLCSFIDYQEHILASIQAIVSQSLTLQSSISQL